MNEEKELEVVDELVCGMCDEDTDPEEKEVDPEMDYEKTDDQKEFEHQAVLNK